MSLNVNITDNYDPSSGFSLSPITVLLECDNQDAKIKYSLDGKNPIVHGILYKVPFIIKESPSREVNLKVAAFTETEVSPVVERQYILIDPLADEDKDGISNIDEGADRMQDTDEDGIPDYLDLDSDNDGLTDKEEANLDLDKNGVLDRLEPLSNEFKLAIETDFEAHESIVENQAYHIFIRCISGRGTFTFKSNLTMSSDTYDGDIIFLGPATPCQIEQGATVSYSFIISQCRSKDVFWLKINSFDLETGDERSYNLLEDVKIVLENDRFPYQGVRISWSKNDAAISYIIQKNDDYSYAEIPALPTSFGGLQWFLDREGTYQDVYSVAYKDVTGKIGPFALPKHAPDLHTGKSLVQGNVTMAGLSPAEGIPIAYRVISVGKNNLIGNTVVVKTTHFAYTDSNGSFSFEVPQSSIVKISIDDAGFVRTYAIPNEKATDLRMLEALPNNNL